MQCTFYWIFWVFNIIYYFIVSHMTVWWVCFRIYKIFLIFFNNVQSCTTPPHVLDIQKHKKDWAQKKLLPVRTSYQKELMSASVLMPYMTNFGKPTWQRTFVECQQIKKFLYPWSKISQKERVLLLSRPYIRMPMKQRNFLYDEFIVNVLSIRILNSIVSVFNRPGVIDLFIHSVTHSFPPDILNIINPKPLSYIAKM